MPASDRNKVSKKDFFNVNFAFYETDRIISGCIQLDDEGNPLFDYIEHRRPQRVEPLFERSRAFA